MNTFNILKTLDIPVWLPQLPQTSMWLKEGAQSHYILVMHASEWTNPDTQNLCLNILKALKWPLEKVAVINKEAGFEESALKGAKVVVFHDGPFKEMDLQVPSLSSMLNSVESKRQAWESLKPFAAL